jgi:DNA-binding transcriptional regulator YiaG
MSSMLPPSDARRHRLLTEMRPQMTKADLWTHRLFTENRPQMAKAETLRKPEVACWREPVGQAIARVQARSGLSLKEFAAAVNRDERQVSRWFTGLEHPQLAAIFTVPALRHLLLVALAELLGDDIEIVTQISIRKAG